MSAWICPRCQQVNAPWMAFCTCKPPTLVVRYDGTGPMPQPTTGTPLPEHQPTTICDSKILGTLWNE